MTFREAWDAIPWWRKAVGFVMFMLFIRSDEDIVRWMMRENFPA